ncbi:hypothetical protein V0R50_10430 [Pseudomonas sp. 148P]|uniref:Uncharacterized protein n=1 Tax=Pseudomonas ulcerans TaxID=3115852 RepID=A0ABU7HQ32_9PSED|nr:MULTISPECIES: hypothetical protein [unclassified Pseudomonas]MEE1922660.1 hypothetical protein [Pseudomonas sp. 147P]MEE1933637.1 hypothetical protein [Pseudomonas sp. 148P]
MKRLKDAFARWKAKHWDEELRIHDSEHFSMIGFDRPPLRRAWDQHKAVIKQVGAWLLALIAGALILKLLGLA